MIVQIRVYALSLALLSFVLGCESTLSTSLEGKSCGAQGQCLPGYVCDPSSNLCVRAGRVDSPNALSNPGCASGQTVCGKDCVVTGSDPR